MIKKMDDFATYTDENGKEQPIQVIKEIENEETKKRYCFYTDIADNVPFEEKQFYVAEIISCADGTEELAEVESEEELAFCQEQFDQIVEELMANGLGDEDVDVEEDEEDEDVVQA